MTSRMAPICGFCSRFRRDAPTLSCDAFPGGIPEEVLNSEFDHRLPLEGDHGLQWDPDPQRGIDWDLYEDILKETWE